MTYPYPHFPSEPTTIQGFALFLINVVLWFFELAMVMIANVLIEIVGAIGQSGANTTSQIIGYLGQAFTNSEVSLSVAGPFAPILASLIWGISIVIIIVAIIKGTQIGANLISNME